MKTLDEVIEGLDVCTHGKGCRNCPYAVYDEDGFEEYLECEKMNVDTLHYLKEYKLAQNLAELGNDPLSWDELKQMEGKPVWVEAESLSVGVSPYWKGWYIINSFSDDEFIHCNDGYEWAKEMQGRMWQAYRKERE